MRRIMVFRNPNHEAITREMNTWLEMNNVVPVSISVTYEGLYFHAFVIYEQG